MRHGDGSRQEWGKRLSRQKVRSEEGSPRGIGLEERSPSVQQEEGRGESVQEGPEAAFPATEASHAFLDSSHKREKANDIGEVRRNVGLSMGSRSGNDRQDSVARVFL